MQICNAYSPHHFRRFRNRISHLTDSGWSLSSFGGPEKIKEKFEAFAHKEYNSEEFKSAEHIANCQSTGADLFNRKVKFIAALTGLGSLFLAKNIKDKIIKFSDKPSHQIFLEPEGLNNNTIYPNGI